MLKISDCFIKKFIKNETHEQDPDRNHSQPTSMVDFKRHKAQLYKFYDNVTEKMSDYKFWRLICRIKGGFGEPAEEVKGLKLKEINCLMKIHWFNDIETCELVERTLSELVDE